MIKDYKLIEDFIAYVRETWPGLNLKEGIDDDTIYDSLEFIYNYRFTDKTKLVFDLRYNMGLRVSDIAIAIGYKSCSGPQGKLYICREKTIRYLNNKYISIEDPWHYVENIKTLSFVIYIILRGYDEKNRLIINTDNKSCSTLIDKIKQDNFYIIKRTNEEKYNRRSKNYDRTPMQIQTVIYSLLEHFVIEGLDPISLRWLVESEPILKLYCDTFGDDNKGFLDKFPNDKWNIIHNFIGDIRNRIPRPMYMNVVKYYTKKDDLRDLFESTMLKDSEFAKEDLQQWIRENIELFM